MTVLLHLLFFFLPVVVVHGSGNNPKSRPYVAYRTSPFDQDLVSGDNEGGNTNGSNGDRRQKLVVTRILEGGDEKRGGNDNNNSGADSSMTKIRKNKINRRYNPRDKQQQQQGENVNDEGDEEDDPRCPLSFRLGSCHGGRSSSSSSSSSAQHQQGGSASSSSTHTPPIIYPLHPDYDAGSGRQILLSADWEMLELWTPSSGMGVRDYRGSATSSSSRGTTGATAGYVQGQSAEQMKEDEQFPLLFEGSSFYHTSPIIHDISGDGVADAILGDYDGTIHIIGLDFEPENHDQHHAQHQRRKRAYKRITIPRLYIRKYWYEYAINRTKEDETVMNMNTDTSTNTNATAAKKYEEFEPYHTYFATNTDESWRGKEYEKAARGVSGNVLTMDIDLANGLAERRRRSQHHGRRNNDGSQNGRSSEKQHDSEESGAKKNDESIEHRRLQEEITNTDDYHVEVGAGQSEEVVNTNHEVIEEIFDKLNNDIEGGVVNQGSVIDDKASHIKANFDDYLSKMAQESLLDDTLGTAPPDGTEESILNKEIQQNWGDDTYNRDVDYPNTMDDYPRYDDYARYEGGGGDDYHYRGGYKPEPPEGYDTYEQYQIAKTKYYHDSNYVQVPPHLLSTCTLVELSRDYTNINSKPEDKVDELLLCSVSYYFDEDECKDDPTKTSGRSFGKHANSDGGDETEEHRGRYVANAIMAYNLRWNYWSLQEVLDLSTDWSAPLGDIVEGGTASIHSNAYNGMGAWALATPVAVKLDGSNSNQIIVGTSMGLVYALENKYQATNRDGWPIQMRHPVEQKVVVEDVVGNTNLEVFVVDTGGDIVSLNADGAVLWARNLLRYDETSSSNKVVHVVRGTSPMSLGDVDGTGKLVVVLLARIATTDHQHTHRPDKHDIKEYRIYALDCVTGDDLLHFPIALDGGSNMSTTSRIPQPLLVDLHGDQHHWMDSLHGLSTESVDRIREINIEASRFDLPKPRPHGGSGRGLHVVQPLGSILHIIEGSTSCVNSIDVGDTIPSMVQADDVHGTGGLDLVVTTSKGEILTLESDMVPYHPLNVWSAGVTRAPGSSNAHAHGFSSTQGIFVHPISRQFRDILGIFIPITFEIFDRRPSMNNQENMYLVDIRAGISVKRTIYTRTFNATGVYTERIQIPFGPGYYALSVRMVSTHGIVYEDTFHIGWNVNYMGGLWLIVCLPLVLASIPILLFKRKPNWKEDDDFGGDNVRGLGILGLTSGSTRIAQ